MIEDCPLGDWSGEDWSTAEIDGYVDTFDDEDDYGYEDDDEWYEDEDWNDEDRYTDDEWNE